jgi:hypothetical protein
MLSVVLTDVAGRALIAVIVRWPVIIGEAAGPQARPIIMSEAYFVGQSEIANIDMVMMVIVSIMMVMVGPRLREAWRHGQGA